jgi:signal transduction histidine kinase/ligand-binding sensor domain-containing protein/DNA-binding response OmpR family regulator
MERNLTAILKMRVNPLCLLVCLFLLANLVKAQQTTGFNFINFKNKDGLSSSSVKAILKDRHGYMWFGTDDGLNRFDGVNFTVYKHNASDSTSLAGNNISALYEDPSGNLWIGTNQSLSLYNRSTDNFSNYTFMGGCAVRSLVSDRSGNLWVGAHSGLYKLSDSLGRIKSYRPSFKRIKKLSKIVLDIYADSRHRIWVGTNSGLFLYNEQGDRLATFNHSDTDESSISDDIIRTIIEDANGNIWFGTNNGFNQLRNDGKSFIQYRHSDTDVNTLSHNCIYDVDADKDGELWVGTEGGLNIFNINTKKSQRIKSDLRNTYGLVGKSVRCIFIDRTGIYWIGTYHGGVNKYDRNLAFFNLRESNPLDNNGLSSSVVTSFAESPDGDIYVGTDGGGLNLYDRETGVFDHPKLTNDDKSRKLPILAMEKAGNELWIGTYQQGLFKLNMLSGKVKQYVKGEKGLNSDEIFCIKKDRNGNIWFGTNGNGVVFYDQKSGRFSSLDKIARLGNERHVVTAGYIRAIEEDQLGNIWIGSSGAGVVVYDPVSQLCTTYNNYNSHLPANVVLSLHSDRKGNMWAGTDAGLSLFDAKAKDFTSYAEQEGLPNAVIHKIIEDSSGKLWVSSNKGISSFSLQNRKFKNFTYHNGLQKNGFSLGAGLMSSKGEIFFGGSDGFNYFDPRALHSNKNIPTLQFMALKISNRNVVPGEHEAIKENISIAKEIRLDYKQNFSLDFFALNFTSPEESRYAYKLDGFDNDWNEVGNLHTAVFTNLDPGQYIFRVKATSDDGLWTTPEKTIRIYVKPPLWRTTYAYIFYAVSLISIIIFIRYRAIRKLKNRFTLEQERKETERQRDFDQLKIKFLTNLSHEFRTPISLIMAPVDKMINQETSIVKQSQLSLVRRNTERLLNLVNQLLDLRKLEENELKLHLGEADIVAFAREITDSFRDIADAKEIQLGFSSSVSSYITQFDQDKIERVLLNLLSNACKFTGKGGKIDLTVEPVTNTNVKIMVADSGIGMSQKVQEKIFDRFFQGEDSGHVLNQGSGIGLSIVKEFVKLHGGTITIESSTEKGSIFTVGLPCKLLADQAAVSENNSIIEQNPLKSQAARIKSVTKLTVLLVEDNDEFRQYLRDHLKDYYRIVEASDGKEGWRKALSSHPHIIVSDISMPGIDGITLCRKLKSDKRTRHIPVILLTALTGHTNHLNGLQTGASDYLTKPFNFDILNVKIRNLVLLNQNLKETYNKQLTVEPAEVAIDKTDKKLLTQVTEYIEANIDSPDLTVEELSRQVFLSRGTLYNKIMELTGETPVEFIRSIKLKKAAALLEKSDMRISQVGYLVGFSSPNYFAKVFKEKYDMSPSEYAMGKRGFANP